MRSLVIAAVGVFAAVKAYPDTTGLPDYDYSTGSPDYDYSTGPAVREDYDYTTGSPDYDYSTGAAGTEDYDYSYTTGPPERLAELESRCSDANTVCSKLKGNCGNPAINRMCKKTCGSC